MPKKTDPAKQVRLTPENYAALLKIKASGKINTSIQFLSNYGVRMSLPKLAEEFGNQPK